MGRSARFESGHFIAAAQEVMAERGPAGLTVQNIAARAGATTGSFYHRFESLDIIAAEAWIEAAENFQSEFARALQGRSLFEIVQGGALCTPDWSRRNLTRARVLLRLDAAELKSAELPEPLRKRLHRLDRDLRATMLSLVKRFRKGKTAERTGTLQFLLVDMPLAAVKPYLKKNQKPPAMVNEFITNSIQGFKGVLG